MLPRWRRCERAAPSGSPDDPALVQPGQVVDWVVSHVTDDADAVFMAGNGFRTVGAIEELELRTGRLVLAANQVLLWSILAATRTPSAVTGYGRLFENWLFENWRSEEGPP